MPGPTASDDDAATAAVATGDGGAGEASSRGEHVGKPVPCEERGRGGKVKAVGGGGGGGDAEWVGAGIEVRAAEDVEMGTEGDGDEVGEAVEVGTAGEWGEWRPSGGGRVEEVRQCKGGVRRKEAEEVALREAKAAAEREEEAGGEEGVPRPRGGAEAGLVGVRKRGKDHRCEVIGEARY